MNILAQNDGGCIENNDFLHNIPIVGDVIRPGGLDERKPAYGAKDLIHIVRIEQTECLQNGWVDWVAKQKYWKHFLTLTFRDEINQANALSMWYRFVKLLNRRVFGSHYTRIVHHSYFSYVLGIERQTRGVLHFHVLIDRPIDYSFIHKIWNDWAGYAWIEKIELEKYRDAVFYVSKYIIKGGELIPYFADPRTTLMVPTVAPIWWFEARALAVKEQHGSNRDLSRA